MSRIDELERTIANRKDSIETSQRFLEKEEKELAALKAESEKPREFVLSLHRDGRYHACPRSEAQDCIVGDGSNPEFFVIEKKPIVITTELAQKMINAGRGFVVTPAWFVRALKAAGIEARCGDE